MATFNQTMSGDSRYSVSLTVTEVLPSDYLTTNKSNVNYILTATKSSGGGYWDNSVENPVVVTINGTNVVSKNISYNFSTSTPCTITLAEGTVEGILHNDDGTKTINVSGSFTDRGNSLGSATASGQLELTTIPRKTSITSFTVAKRTETSLTFNWATADTVDYVWYSTNNGSSWTGYDVTDGTSGSFAVSGLTENTTYNCKIRVRRKDSQLTTDSNTVSQTTNAYPSFATQPTYSARTETTLDVTYKPNMTVGSAQYRIKTTSGSYGSWININSSNIISGSATSTAGCTFRISSLATNTNYVVQVRLKSALSDNYTNSNEVSTNMYTYAYPYITAIETSNLTIGNSQKVTLYNPLKRTVTIKMNQNNISGTELYSGTTSSTSLQFTPTKTTLYASIPNATNGNCVYSATYGNVVTTLSGKYTINVNECKPTFSDFTYSTNLSELTGNNATIVNGETTTTFTISTTNKATGVYSASVTKYRLECGNQTTDVTYSSSSSVSGAIVNCTNQIIKVTAIDSRGLETTVQKTVTNYKTYSKPSFRNITADRNDGVEATTKLNFRLNYWNDSFGNVTNSIVYVAYRSKLTTASDYGSYTSIPISNLAFSNGIATLKDYLIHANGSSGGFEIGKAYNIQVMVRDGSSSYTLETIYGYPNVTDGNVAFSTYQDGNGKYHSGLNGMPNASYTNIINGNERITDNLSVLGYTDTNKLIIEDFEEGHNLDSGGGTSGYWYVCDITSTGAYQDQPIEFYIIQRNRYGKIFIRPTGSGTTGVLGVGYAYIEGHSDFNAYYYYANNKIQLYVQKQQGWDNADVYVRKARYMRGINIIWNGSTVSSLPTNYVTIATNTKKLNISGNASTATNATKATQDSDGVAINTGYLRRREWWNVSETHNANTDLANGGIVFAYGNKHSSGTTGTLADFTCSSNTKYNLQIQGDYNGNNLLFRNRNGDNNTWGAWKTVAVNANWVAGTTKKVLTSQSHSNWTNNATDDAIIPSMSFIAFWNGAYSSSGGSNLTYAYQGIIQCKPTNLYNNSSGTTGTVTLSQTSANFNYIDIWFQGNNKTIDFVRVYSPNGKGVNLHTANSNGTNTWFQMNVCRISGTSITREGKYEHTINNSVVAGLGSGNYVYILRVDGYK